MYEAFCKNVLSAMKEQMGEEYEVQINHVVKNNGVELDGLVARRRDEAIAPTIYLNDFYQAYQDGKDMIDILSEIVSIIREEEKKEKPEVLSHFDSFDTIKDRVIFRLVNYDKNKTELDRVPHIRYLDLAVTFHYLVKCESEEIGTIRIQKEMLKRWGITKKQLWEAAKINTPNLFPIQIRTMNEVIGEILKKETGISDIESTMPQSEMYVVTNQSGINGASVLLYDNAIQSFATTSQSDFYILPSSIHEVILIPYRNNFSKSQLSEMVCDVNETQVPDEDILSSRVYIYHRNKNAIEM